MQFEAADLWVYSQETGRHASTLTLKWRRRGSGWGRASSSCPMPTPLLDPQLDNPSQVSLLGATLMNLLKKNISEPFQLTLLNIGVTNFVGNKGASAGGSSALGFSHTLLHIPCLPLSSPSSALPLFSSSPSSSSCPLSCLAFPLLILHSFTLQTCSPLLHPFFFPSM